MSESDSSKPADKVSPTIEERKKDDFESEVKDSLKVADKEDDSQNDREEDVSSHYQSCEDTPGSQPNQSKI